MRPADVPEIYLARIRAGDVRGLGALFAPDALFQGPAGVLGGREAIERFYAGVFQASSQQHQVGRTVVEGSRVVFELIPTDPPRPPHDPTIAIDLMEIDAAGLIEKFTVYLRPPPQA